jgi:bifunctional UDP-N-acetylglucosamine pyrophosphorylase / glucosamine-1-phosphate N-acetyltransferase
MSSTGNRPLAVVLLAAGQGTRMKSAHAKVLHPLGGRPLVQHVLRTVASLGAERTVVVVGHQADAVRAACEGFGVSCAHQAEQRGTGHATAIARDACLSGFAGDVLILYGDVPLLRAETIGRLLEGHRSTQAGLSLLTTVLEDPTGYGRIVRDEAGTLSRIVEQKDASEDVRRIREVNPGIYCVRSEFLFPALDRLEPNNAQAELYLTDIVAQAVGAGIGVRTEPAPPAEVEGINSRADLAALEASLRDRLVRKHLDAGVSFLDPVSVWIEDDVEIGPDTAIGPQVQLRGRTRIGRDCRIDGTAFLVDAELADRVHLRPNVVIAEARIESDAVIGPFAHLRPGTQLGSGVHIGNFVEVKKSTIGAGTKANHLAYLGDATIGRETNIGAGTITCNYDGFEKHPTLIGDRVQVGSDSQLVAPVKIGDDAYVATGTTVRHDVAPGALAFNPKGDQRRDGWVASFRARKKKRG